MAIIALETKLSLIRHLDLGVLGTTESSVLVLPMDKRDLSPVRPVRPIPVDSSSEPGSQSVASSSQEEGMEGFPEELDKCTCPAETRNGLCLFCEANLTDGISTHSEVDDVIDPAEEGILTFRIGKHIWVPFVGRDIRGKHDVTH